MHSVDWAVVVAAGEEFLAFDGASDDVADKRILLGQVSSEVHLLPLKSLSDAQSWEAKVRPNRGTFHEVKQAIYKSGLV